MNARVLDRIELPQGLGFVTLYDWTEEEVADGQNLVRTDCDGKLVWRTGARIDPDDCFTQVEWDGTQLKGWSWSGYQMAIDIKTGNSSDLVFTK
jgi:hypothetical protein